jgi:hypothetical protein
MGINEGIKLLRINERDLREEDKEEGEDLKGGSHFFSF